MSRIFPFDPAFAEALPALVTIRQGGVIIRLNTAGINVIVTVGDVGYLYAPWPGADITGLQYPSDGTPANADLVLMAVPNSPIQPGDGIRGLLDDWPITIELFDPGNLAAGTFMAISGTIGSVDEDTRGMLTIAANGQLRLASERSMTEKYSLTGRESLGDDRCKIPLCVAQDIAAFDIGRSQDFVRPDFHDGTTGLIRVKDAYGRVRTGVANTVEDYANVYFECTTAGTTDTVAPTYDPTVGNTTIDGTVHFIARNAWTRAARGHATDEYSIKFDALPDSRASDATWYPFGGIFIRSGSLAGYPVLGINTWDPVNFVATLFLPILVDSVPANTQFEVHVGCDLLAPMCENRFANIINRRAEDLVPPPDTITGL